MAKATLHLWHPLTQMLQKRALIKNGTYKQHLIKVALASYMVRSAGLALNKSRSHCNIEIKGK